MLEQFLKSTLAHFCKVEPMNAYIQEMPKGVKYPCYLVNKVDISTQPLNQFYFNNTISVYIRIFGEDEIGIKNKTFNLINNVFANYRKIPILNEDGTESERFIRVENIESIDITVDENEIYCTEINFSFDTTFNVTVEEFELLGKVNSTEFYKQEENE